MARPKVSYRIETQLVTIHNRAGDRIREARKGRWRMWKYHANQTRNMSDAVKYVTQKMVQDRIGGIVAIRQYVNGRSQDEYTKVYQAKWGTDNRPFLRFEGPAGEWWMRRLPKTLVQKLRQIRAS